MLQTLDPDKLAKFLKEKPRTMPHKFIRTDPKSGVFRLAPAWKNNPPRGEKETGPTPHGPSVLFTAAPAKLRTFLAKHGSALIWDKEYVFKRGNADSFEKRWQKYDDRIQAAEVRRKKDEIRTPKLDGP